MHAATGRALESQRLLDDVIDERAVTVYARIHIRIVSEQAKGLPSTFVVVTLPAVKSSAQTAAASLSVNVSSPSFASTSL